MKKSLYAYILKPIFKPYLSIIVIYNMIHRFYHLIYISLLFIVFVFPTKLHAQEYKVEGQILESVDFVPIVNASVKLFTKDSVYIKGVQTNENGSFNISLKSKGDYKINVSFLGYKSLSKNFTIKSKTTKLGTLLLEQDTIMLEGAVVVGNLPKVQMVQDTLIYNAGAYMVEEGSVLDELIERLPGAEVTDDGITINGKKIQKILLDGKEFFVGDLNTARKNIPVEIIDKLKVYDEKSDMSRITGIDDGNDRAIIDVRIKKGMNVGYMLNGNVGFGNHSRYNDRLNISTFKSTNRLSLIGNTSNVGSNRSGGSEGLRTNNTFGLNYNYQDMSKKGRNSTGLKMDGSIQLRNSKNDRQTVSMNENWEKVGARTYSNSISKNISKNNNWNADYNIEWRPDTLTNIQFRPSWGYSSNDGLSSSESMQFSDDPYQFSSYPLDLYQNFDDKTLIRTNRRTNNGISFSDNKRIGGTLQYNRRFGNMGRNINLRIEANHNSQKSQNLSSNMVHLYKKKDIYGNDSIYYNNRYNVNPNNSYNYSLNISYSEPIFKGIFLQLNYTFSYSQNETNRTTYRLDEMAEHFSEGITARYRGFEDYLSNIGENLNSYIDTGLSKFGKYENTNHNLQLLYRMNREHYIFSTGIRLEPQYSHFVQEWHNIKNDTTRTVFNFNPTMNLQIRFTPKHNLKIDYHGNSSQPDINDLLDITDDSNPLYITKGNPGLKPSFTNNLTVEWNNYLIDTNTSFNARWQYSMTSNSVSNIVTYNDDTGGRISQPQNINGNWNSNGTFNFNTSLDKNKNWNINSSTSVNYSNRVSYITINKNTSSQENITKNTNWNQNIGGSFRNDWLEIELSSGINYSHVRNMLMSTADRDTWKFSYGGSFDMKLPWNMMINTSLRESSYRGYSDASANTNELIWNATISQSLLKRKLLQIKLQIFDILGQKRNFSYNVSDTRISESHYNSINQYGMLSVILNIRSFGGRAARNSRMENRQRGGDSEVNERRVGGETEVNGRRGEGVQDTNSMERSTRMRSRDRM